MNSVLHYKGYSAKPEYSADDQIFYGKVLGISDLVDFYTENAKKIESEFHQAVDDYIAFCKEIGKEPQRAYSGSFNVRISPELHKQASIRAQNDGVSLNKVVDAALREYLDQEKERYVIVAPKEIVESFALSTTSRQDTGKQNYSNPGYCSGYFYNVKKEGSKIC
ncbi:type II toxin-antitoxin system HicB family antitoxin [Faecalibacterium sp. An192]|uniref:type II toxin-antitoxin system HicB family antitoxin n=1 Tax=Faecalibacterium sp. An192 TaxID=1965581 RepID=UPI000B37B9D7|nr:type II toxin-antitoxin system HicB family antitoxin [Faecalibacterium sp. An192]OUP26935.1 hypothetical protein B5F27_11895 [Faecalibacterium sp. An192]